MLLAGMPFVLQVNGFFLIAELYFFSARHDVSHRSIPPASGACGSEFLLDLIYQIEGKARILQ